MSTVLDSPLDDPHATAYARAVEEMYDIVSFGIKKLRDMAEAQGFSREVVDKTTFLAAENQTMAYFSCPKPAIIGSAALSGAYHALLQVKPAIPPDEMYSAILKVLELALDCEECRQAFLGRLEAPSLEAVVRAFLLVEAVRPSPQ